MIAPTRELLEELSQQAVAEPHGDLLPLQTWDNEGGLPYLLFLHKVIKVLAPRIVVELGTMKGGSAKYMARALPPGGIVFTLDIKETAKDYCKDFPGIVAITGDSKTYWRCFNVPIDVLYLDSAHDYLTTKSELEHWVEKVVPGGLVL